MQPTEVTLAADADLRLSQTAEGRWIAVSLRSRKGYVVPRLAAALLVRAADPVSETNLAAWMDECGVPAPLLSSCRSAGLLVAVDDAYRERRQERKRWKDHDWLAAYDYHVLTYGYPFEWYEKGRSVMDQSRMNTYSASDPDVDRFLVLQHRSAVPVPPPSNTREPEIRTLDVDSVAFVLSMMGGIVLQARNPWPHSAPALRKTSPSGGSRHPTELFIRTHSVRGLPDGYHHYNPREKTLGFLSPVPALSDAPRCDVHYVTHFARNRYRYREPRTFRTVHMDVGHLIGTCDLLAGSLELDVSHELGSVPDAVLVDLNLVRTEDCAMALSILSQP